MLAGMVTRTVGQIKPFHDVILCLRVCWHVSIAAVSRGQPEFQSCTRPFVRHGCLLSVVFVT